MLKKFALMLCALCLTACVTNDYHYTNYPSTSFIAQNNRAVNSLSEQLLQRFQQDFSDDCILVVATVARMDDASQTSSFGRLVTEHIAARLLQLNYNIVTLNPEKTTMTHSDEGDLVLSDATQQVVRSFNAKAVVIGTYTENVNDIYINLKVINPTDSVIIAAHSYAIPRAPNNEDLLNQLIQLY